jgi:hypothetical protein
MPLFIDMYNLPGITEDSVGQACEKIREVEGKYDINLMHTCFDQSTGKGFCLYEAPNTQASDQARREAHGLVPDEVFQVEEVQAVRA